MKRLLLGITVVAALLLGGCDKIGDETAGDGSPEVTSTFPFAGASGEEVNIYGYNFGTDAGSVKVTFDGIQAEILSVTANNIKVTIPENEEWTEDRLILMQVFVDDFQSRRYSFSLKVKPFLIYILPGRGIPGDEVEILGRRFSPDKAKNTVMFGADEAEILSASSDALKVRIPEGDYRKSDEVTVIRDGHKTSNTVTFFYDTEAVDYETLSAVTWTTETVSAGIVWKKADFEAFGDSRSVNVLEVDPAQVQTIDIAYKLTDNKSVRAMCEEADAKAGINASFFTTSGPDDYFRYNGAEIVAGRNTTLAHVDAAMIMNSKSDISFASILPNRNTTAKGLPGKTVMVCGPLLTANDLVLPQMSTDQHFTEPHPRTAIGVTADKKVLLVTVDGRQTNKVGLPIRDLSVLMKALGAVNSMSLDGGGSTSMYIKGKGNNGIVNSPSSTDRAVATVIYVK